MVDSLVCPVVTVRIRRKNASQPGPITRPRVENTARINDLPANPSNIPAHRNAQQSEKSVTAPIAYRVLKTVSETALAISKQKAHIKTVGITNVRRSRRFCALIISSG
jgi:hypothetical protein